MNIPFPYHPSKIKIHVRPFSPRNPELNPPKTPTKIPYQMHLCFQNHGIPSSLTLPSSPTTSITLQPTTLPSSSSSSFNELSHPTPSLAPVHYSLRRDNHPFLPDSGSPLLLPSGFNSEFSVMGISNSVICITSGFQCLSLIICNPCVRRYVTLPKPRNYSSLYNASVGFGFDSKNNDCKVVRICSMMDDERFGLCVPEVEVYSLATGFWRNCSNLAPVCSLCYAPHGFINGVIHWSKKRRASNYNDNGSFIFSTTKISSFWDF